MLPPFTLLRPGSVAEAAGLLSEDAVAYVGGTELLLAMRMGLYRPETLVDLKSVPGLDHIEVRDGSLVIGAAVTHDVIARSPLVREHVPVLARTEAGVGNARVRAQGSIGGNLCFAEPRSDVATVLIALGASMHLVSAAGRRAVPAAGFVLGPYWTAREPEELLVEVSVPLPAAAGVYLKYVTVERPTTSVAAVRLGDGSCRVVVGAVGPVPVAAEYEDAGAVDVAGLVELLDPTPDLTGTDEYKRHVSGVYVRRALAELGRTA